MYVDSFIFFYSQYLSIFNKNIWYDSSYYLFFITLKCECVNILSSYKDFEYFLIKFFFSGLIVMRSGLGYCCIVLLFLIIKYILCVVDKILIKCGMKIIDDELNRHIPLLDITYKYLTFYLVSFNIIVLIPILQNLLSIRRQSFCHEAK